MWGLCWRGALSALALWVAMGGTAAAAPATFSSAPMGEFVLTGPGQVQWIIRNNVFSCDSGAALGVYDAEFSPTRDDAFDDGLIVSVGGVPFVSPDMVDLTGQTLTSGPIPMSGLDVTLQYAALQDRPALRTFIGLHNPNAVPIMAAVDIQTNFGSDNMTTGIATGTRGFWLITADDPITPSDAVNTTVYAGAQSGMGEFDYDNWIGSTTDTVYTCSGTEGFGVTNNVIIPPGSSLNFLYLNEIHDAIAAATTSANASFESVPPRTSSFFQDLSDDQLIHTGNYSFFGERVLNGGGARWWVYNWAGTDTGAVDGNCEYSPGLAVGDASLDPDGANKTDALDDGLVMYVDGKIVVAPLTTPLVSGNAVTVGPVSMSGLDVSVNYTALQASPTLRTIASFSNPTTAPITVDVKMNTNVGSDSGTKIQQTSSGDKVVTASDRWIVTSDSDTTPSDPVNTHVVEGPGTPVVMPTALLSQGTDCSSTNGIQADYSLTVPAGATRRLLFFNDLHAANAEGVSTASVYDRNPDTGSALVTGLDAVTLAEIVNWAFCASDTRICETGDACVVGSCGATGGCDRTALPRAATFVSVGCRLTSTASQVGTVVPAVRLKDKLTALLANAQGAAQQASTATGKARKKAVGKALKALKTFGRKLKSKAAKKAISAGDLAALRGAAADLLADLKTLKTAP